MKSFVGYVEAMRVHKPYIAMLFVQCVYSGMALFSKAAISQKGMNPAIFVFYRQAFATVAMAPLAFLFERFVDFMPRIHILLFSIFQLFFPKLTFIYCYAEKRKFHYLSSSIPKCSWFL